jgi:DNA-binding NarL/FixJ family response regulator
VRKMLAEDQSLNIYLVSDQPVLLRGFAGVLSGSDIHIAGSCHSAAFTKRFDIAFGPAIVLLDVRDGAAAELKFLQRHARRCPVVLWTGPLSSDFISKTLDYGVRAIIPRTSLKEQLIDTLRRVGSGELHVGFGHPRGR